MRGRGRARLSSRPLKPPWLGGWALPSRITALCRDCPCRGHREPVRANSIPEDLFRGPFDQRWGWKDDLCGPVWIGAELEALYQSGVPFHML